MPNSDADHLPDSGSGAAALLAGFLGWSLDAFDFFLVVMCLTAIGHDFHKTDAEMTAAIAITLAFRPVGAFLFGLIADRYGRRLPLVIDLIVYSAVEVLSGLAHNFTTFLVLRAIFGIAMGGEWGVGASLALEKVPARFRGVLSGLLQEGYAFGYLLAAVAYAVVFPRFGWRPLFFIGGLPALLAIFVRAGVSESEAWRREKSANWASLGNAIVHNAPIFLYMVLLMAMLNLASHGTQDLYPTFLKRHWHFAVNRVAWITVLANVGAILGGLMFGGLSDRIGRRKAMVLAFCGALLAIPLWALPGSVTLLVIGAFVLQFMVQGAWGIIPAHLNELAPPMLRGFLPGFAYQTGNLIASQISPYEAKAAARWGYPHTLAVAAAGIFLVAVVVVSLGKERRGVTFGNADPVPV